MVRAIMDKKRAGAKEEGVPTVSKIGHTVGIRKERWVAVLRSASLRPKPSEERYYFLMLSVFAALKGRSSTPESSVPIKRSQPCQVATGCHLVCSGTGHGNPAQLCREG